MLLKIEVKRIIFITTLLLIAYLSNGQIINKSQSIGNSNKGSADLLKIKATKDLKTSPVDESQVSVDSEYVEKVVVVSKLAPAGVDINYLPLFGGYLKSEEQLIEDQLFLSDCDREFASRIKAAEFFNEIAWQYLNDGDKITATHRFNLSFLLNPDHYDNFWGLGVIEYQDGNLSNAIDLMQTGLELTDSSNFIFMTDLATIYLKQAITTVNAIYETGKAKELLEKAIELQPNYAGAYTQLAIVRLLENKPAEAWACFHQSLELNPAEINREVLSELLSRMEDPKGIFVRD